jgi:Chromo (CHRromatin Organisation MOdifier) domain
LQIDAKKSTAFHPQTDGQTERLNQILEQYVRIFCNYQQYDWCSLLPLAEFAYNNAYQESTKMSPFYANYGFNPRFLTEIITTSSPHSAPAAQDFASHLQEVHERLVENVKISQDYQARYYDAKHKPMQFQPGDLVWLNASNISTSRPSKKLDWKRLGPFKIIKRVGLQSYQLDLPPTMKIHDVFHVSLLDPYKSSSIPAHSFPPAPPPLYVQDDQEYWEVENILDSKFIGRRLYYLVKWKGFPDSDNSWQPRSNIPARALIQKYHKNNPSRPGPKARPQIHFVSLLQ